jgi:toxin YoeB
MALGAVLRRADEHLHEIVVQGIEELTLEAPFKLRVIEVAWMKIEIISVHRNGFIFELDDDLDTLPLGARGEVQERVLIEPELSENAIEARSCWIHEKIVEHGRWDLPRSVEREAIFHPEFRQDLRYWVKADRKIALRALELIEGISRDPFTGIGKPEPLKYLLAECRSRRLTQEHRLVYRVSERRIDFLQARYHY